VDAELRHDVARWLLLARRGTLLRQIDGSASPAGGPPLTPR
jgi:hypothetical protein